MTNPVSKQTNRGHQFSTFGGVFTPSILTIFGVIMFMRAPFVVGEAGILFGLAILVLSKTITTLTALSIGAISTNMEIRGGGAYFLISRVLGPEFGGAIGISLFFAAAVSVPFYVLGFSEALCLSFPPLMPYFQYIAYGSALILLVVTLLGADWAMRAQYLILAILTLSIFVMLGGLMVRFQPELLTKNFWPDYSSLPQGEGSYSFWSVFAIYFPAVTGILAGVNMSGDLRSPSKSIPRGTLWAIFVGFVVYALQLFLCGVAFERDLLKNHPYEILEAHALWGAGWLIMTGMFVASLSSAIGSYLGAPRILQAVARDNIMPILSPFSKGSGEKDEPRLALVLTAGITLFVIWWAGNQPKGGALNFVASIISMFFLYTYGMINLAAFVEAFSQNPSFRPRFRYFHWSLALLGLIGCVVAAFLIQPIDALLAIAILGGLYGYLLKKRIESSFSDVRRGFVYSRLQVNLHRLDRMEESPKNWRPVVLVFSGNPKMREALVSYAVWMEAGRGIVLFANVLTGDLEDFVEHRERAIRQLRRFCQEKNIPAFPEVVVAPTVHTGMEVLLQTAGMGPIQPNLVAFGFPSENGPEHLKQFCRILKIASKMGKSLLLLHGDYLPSLDEPKRIDIWWRGRKNGALMLLLAHLLQQNWEWIGAEIRVLRLVEQEQGIEPAKKALLELIEAGRVEAHPEVICSRAPFEEILHEHSKNSTCTFLGFELPEPGEERQWCQRYHKLVKNLSTVVLVSSQEYDVLL